MAIYWIDFMQAANGTGTYASPFSGAVAQTLVAGDEIRVKSVLKSSIWDATFGNLTPGSYKMNYNSNKNGGGSLTNTQLFKHPTEATISFNTSYLYYIVELDTYFMTQNTTFNTSTYNSISESFIYTTPTPIPISWNDGLDHLVTVKLVNSTYRAKSHTGSQTFLGAPSVAVDNITITDGWIDATTRLTDGTAVTIYQSGYTSSFSYFYLRYLKGNSVVDLGNTVFADKTFGVNYLIQNIDFCGPINITYGAKVCSYSSSNTLQIGNFDDTVVGNFSLTIKNYVSPASSSYYISYVAQNTAKLTVTVDIQKLATINANVLCGHQNESKNYNLKIGQLTVVSYSQYGGTYGVIYTAAGNPIWPYLTLYGEVSVVQPLNETGNNIAFIIGDYSQNILKKLDVLFNLKGISYPNTISATTPAKNGCFFSVLIDAQNNFFNTIVSSSINTSSYVFPISNTIIFNNKKNLNMLQNNQIEYNPIKSTILGMSKAAANLLYTTTQSMNFTHGNALYYPATDNYTYLLAKINDSIATETYYTYPANRCIMEENTVTFKTVVPSYKISVDGPTTSYKEFFHRWNIPVEAGTTYTIKFYTSMVGGLPSNYFRNYNFALRYNYGSVLTSTITTLSQGGWEEQLFTFTSSYAQILSLDMFLTQPQNITTELYISDFTVTSI